jgi:FkbM family methyltransferase
MMSYNTEEFIKNDLPHKSELLKHFSVHDKLTIFDIGSCEAEDSIRYSLLFPNAEIYAFEPLPANYVKCQNNIAKYKKQNIKLFNVALSNTIGNSDFYVSNGSPDEKTNTAEWDYGNKSSSLLAPDKVKEVFKWLKFDDKVTVKTSTIHNVCLNEGVSQIDIVHMDVQGAELLVLQGAGKWIQKIKVIWLEAENVTLYKDQPLKKDIEQFMKAQGFVKTLDSVVGVAGDLFYVNTKYVDQEKKELKGFKNLISKFYYKYFNKRYYQQDCFSQHGEDLIIDSCLQSLGIVKPSYIDIGSHHPYRLSNTFHFYLRGCRGINIEPDPILFELFRIHRKEDVNLNMGVYNENQKLIFYLMHPNTLNTFNKEESDNYVRMGHKRLGEKLIEVKLLSEILNTVNDGAFPDFMSIDIEGLDLLVLKTINYKTNYPKVICVETTIYDGNKVDQRKNTEITEFLLSQGYIIYADTFINTILYKK